MTRVKPCAKCHHPKSRHRRHECRHTWQTHGQTFMGTSVITKWCTCDGYQEPCQRLYPEVGHEAEGYSCSTHNMPWGECPEPGGPAVAEHDARCMTLTGDEHPDVCDCRTLALVDALARHEFIGVAGHPDDDECTYRADGTDATYCGEPAAAHESGGSR